MKKLLLFLFLGSSVALHAQSNTSEAQAKIETSEKFVITETEYLTVMGQPFLHEGRHYLSFTFTNKTDRSVRFMYSIYVNGERQTLHFDETQEAIASLKPQGRFTFGDDANEHPLIAISAHEWMKNTIVELTLLNE